MNKPELHLVQGRDDDLPTSTLFEHGDYRVIVGEHPDHGQVYLAVGNGKGTSAMFCEAAMALSIAGAIVAAAAKAIEKQFQRELGGS